MITIRFAADVITFHLPLTIQLETRAGVVHDLPTHVWARVNNSGYSLRAPVEFAAHIKRLWIVDANGKRLGRINNTRDAVIPGDTIAAVVTFR